MPMRSHPPAHGCKRISCLEMSSDTVMILTMNRQEIVRGIVIVLFAGTFGKVYTVECRKKPGQLYAMKELVRSSHPKYVEMELSILQHLGGTCNIMQVNLAIISR